MNKSLAAFENIKKKYQNNINGRMSLLERLSFNLIEKELQKPQELYNKIKEKRDNIRKDLHKDIVADKIKEVKEEVIGQVAAYNDVLSLMESMFEVER